MYYRATLYIIYDLHAYKIYNIKIYIYILYIAQVSDSSSCFSPTSTSREQRPCMPVQMKRSRRSSEEVRRQYTTLNPQPYIPKP